MAEWHAYVTRPDTSGDPTAPQVPLLDIDRAGGEPAGTSGSLPNQERQVASNGGAATPSEQTTREAVIPDPLPVLDQVTRPTPEHPPGAAYSLADLAASVDPAAARKDESVAALEQELDLHRRLLDSIAREQQLIAREQTLRAYVLHADREPRRSATPTPPPSRRYQEQRRPVPASRDWAPVVTWIAILFGLLISALIVYLLY
jgi:hypothetical protein